MVMEMFRPHIMIWTVLGPPTKDAKGFETDGSPLATYSVPCRFAPSGGQSSIKEFKNEDNTVVKQVGQIRFDAGEHVPDIGQIVTVTEGDLIHFTGKVRDKYFGQQLRRWRVDV